MCMIQSIHFPAGFHRSHVLWCRGDRPEPCGPTRRLLLTVPHMFNMKLLYCIVQCIVTYVQDSSSVSRICNLIFCGRISSSTPLSPIFGDPCPGYMKELRIQYEICGVKGSVTVSEVRGFLRKKLVIQSSPTIKPLIFAGKIVMQCHPLCIFKFREQWDITVYVWAKSAAWTEWYLDNY